MVRLECPCTLSAVPVSCRRRTHYPRGCSYALSLPASSHSSNSQETMSGSHAVLLTWRAVHPPGDACLTPALVCCPTANKKKDQSRGWGFERSDSLSGFLIVVLSLLASVSRDGALPLPFLTCQLSNGRLVNHPDLLPDQGQNHPHRGRPVALIWPVRACGHQHRELRSTVYVSQTSCNPSVHICVSAPHARLLDGEKLAWGRRDK